MTPREGLRSERRIDVVATRRSSMPRDRVGYPVGQHGRGLIVDAVTRRDGRAPAPEHVRTDVLRRWSITDRALHASVAHCGAEAVVALHPRSPIGIDMQDRRPRPLALSWLGELVGLRGPATIAQFAECEALIKASHLTKASFLGVRLPEAAPQWRPIHDDYWVLTMTRDDGTAVALATTDPMPVSITGDGAAGWVAA